MRFALLGDHPDGLAMARALIDAGRNELVAYSGSPVGLEYLRRWHIAAKAENDIEEVLADPAVEAVIVASPAADRGTHLRRALQSERDVLCVHPCDDSPDIAYEAAMIQADTRKMLFPILPEALHPAVQKLAALLQAPETSELHIELERAATEAVLLEANLPKFAPAVPGWDVLRLLGGEIAEVMGLATGQKLPTDSPVLLAGRFERGGLFQMTLSPSQKDERWRCSVQSGPRHFELVFPQGWPGPARLRWPHESGSQQEETWDSWNPWSALVDAFEAATRTESSRPNWQDEVRCLELDDAARRSVERRRASTLEYQEVSEEVGFKGAMTLVGCGLLWLSAALLILSIWVPWLAWMILPMFGVFLLLQILRRLVPPKPSEQSKLAIAPSQGDEEVRNPPT